MEIKQNILNAVNEWLTQRLTQRHKAVKELLAGSPKN
jgi:predicted XRE-type DNA-binding protein